MMGGMHSRSSAESDAPPVTSRWSADVGDSLAEYSKTSDAVQLSVASSDSGEPPRVPLPRVASAPDGAATSGAPSSPVDARIAALAARQRGVVHRDQLLAVGLHRSSLARRVRAGRLHPVLPRVFAVGHVALPVGGREAAALLWRGPWSALSHESAAWVLGLAPIPALVHVSGAVGGSASRSDVVAHRVAVLAADDVHVRNGLRVTRPARTLLDLAATAEPRQLDRLVAEARLRRLVDERELREVVSRHPRRRGGARLLALLDAEREPAMTRSDAERRFRDLMRRSGMPMPLASARVAGFEVDALWADERVIVEVDGFAFHRSRQAFERDRRKAGVLEASGFRVLRVSWRQIVEAPETVVASVATALARGR